MSSLLWYHYLLIGSFLACIAGLSLIFATQHLPVSDHEATEQMLFKMSFAYWMVYCGAFALQHLPLPTWETLELSLKFTLVISYLLTFSCVLTLPLHRFSASLRQVE